MATVTNKIQLCLGKLFERSSYGSVSFYNVRFSKYAKSPTNNGSSNITSANRFHNNDGSLQIRYNDAISFIGLDGRRSNGLANEFDQQSTIPANAIFFGLGDSASYRADGKDLRQHGKNSKGDILLSRNPENIGGIGWIQASDYSQSSSNVTWQNGNYFRIPVIYAETSANRIPNPTRGQMMFDRTLGKPIWYNGSTWVDATGMAIS